MLAGVGFLEAVVDSAIVGVVAGGGTVPAAFQGIAALGPVAVETVVAGRRLPGLAGARAVAGLLAVADIPVRTGGARGRDLTGAGVASMARRAVRVVLAFTAGVEIFVAGQGRGARIAAADA